MLMMLVNVRENMKVVKAMKKQAERPRQSAQSTRKNQRKNKTNKSDRCAENNILNHLLSRIVTKNKLTLLLHRENTVAEVTTAGHSPTSSNGLTIEEFLTRYPEVKRLSSR